MANFMQMMQKASQVKSRMQEMQAKVHDMEVTGAASNDQVTCKMNGRFRLTALSVSPALISGGDREIIEDLVLVAVNDARDKVEKLMADETQKIMSDLGLPPGLELPF